VRRDGDRYAASHVASAASAAARSPLQVVFEMIEENLRARLAGSGTKAR
jgi:hypothetical protein